jgi:hypothetical protein
MIEEQLRLAVVEGKRVVDHHEIHVGVAPVDQRVAEQEKRCRKAGDDGRQSPSPAEEVEPVDGVRHRGDRRRGRCGWGGKFIHAGGVYRNPRSKATGFTGKTRQPPTSAAKR